MIAWLLLSIAGFGAIIAVFAIRIAAAKTREQADPSPRCGNCGYNLTGSPSNRCPECGELFVEAGVVRGTPPQAQKPPAVILSLALALGLAFAIYLAYFATRRPVIVTMPTSAPAASSPAATPATPAAPNDGP